MERPPNLRRRLILNSLLAPALASLAVRSIAQPGVLFSEADLAHAALLRDQGLRSNLAYELMASLVNEVGPRPAGSPADAKAVEWGKAQFQRLGFANVRAEPVELEAWQRGATAAMLLAPHALDKDRVASVAGGAGLWWIDRKPAHPGASDLGGKRRRHRIGANRSN